MENETEFCYKIQIQAMQWFVYAYILKKFFVSVFIGSQVSQKASH